MTTKVINLKNKTEVSRRKNKTTSPKKNTVNILHYVSLIFLCICNPDTSTPSLAGTETERQRRGREGREGEGEEEKIKKSLSKLTSLQIFLFF